MELAGSALAALQVRVRQAPVYADTGKPADIEDSAAPARVRNQDSSSLGELPGGGWPISADDVADIKTMADAWTGPAIEIKTASEFAAALGRVWQELESGAVEIVVDAKTGAIRGYVVKDLPPSLARAEDMIAQEVREYIAAAREANRRRGPWSTVTMTTAPLWR